MSDLTVLYITACRTPPRWRQFHLEHLKKATNDLPVLASAPEPVPIGWYSHQEGPHSYGTIYREMLRLSRLADTRYVAMAEDDVLYTRTHFTEFRPPMDAVAYDRSRWSLYTWNPVFHLKNRLSNAALIAPREYLIDALEERERKYPDGVPEDRIGEVGRMRIDRRLRVQPRKCVEFWGREPIVHLHHPSGCDIGDAPGWRKTYGQVQAFEIPYWGHARDIVAKYKEPGWVSTAASD